MVESSHAVGLDLEIKKKLWGERRDDGEISCISLSLLPVRIRLTCSDVFQANTLSHTSLKRAP